MTGLFGGSFNALARAAFGGTTEHLRAQQKNALAQIGQNGEGYGSRPDGTPKGRGYLGEIKTPQGYNMTEYSIGVDFGNGEMDIPTLVPTLTPAEVEMVRREQLNDEIVRKAQEYALARMRLGLSPFAVKGFDY